MSAEGGGPEAPAEGASAHTPDGDNLALEGYEPPAKLRFESKGAKSRRRWPIRAYVGANGHGKTLAAVHDASIALDQGRKVLSTVRLIDPQTGRDHPHYERLTDWGQVLEAHDCDILFDEIIGIANSRSSQGMPVQVQTLLNQLRRRNIQLMWTAPAWNRSDLVIREVTQLVTVCRGYLPKKQKLPGEDQERVWGANRLFRWTSYDAIDFTAWTDNSEAKLKGKVNTWIWRPGIRAEALYDTLDAVDRVGEVLDSGRCAHCGGVRAAPKCTCDRSESAHSKGFLPTPVVRAAPNVAFQLADTH